MTEEVLSILRLMQLMSDDSGSPPREPPPPGGNRLDAALAQLQDIARRMAVSGIARKVGALSAVVSDPPSPPSVASGSPRVRRSLESTWSWAGCSPPRRRTPRGPFPTKSNKCLGVFAPESHGLLSGTLGLPPPPPCCHLVTRCLHSLTGAPSFLPFGPRGLLGPVHFSVAITCTVRT